MIEPMSHALDVTKLTLNGAALPPAFSKKPGVMYRRQTAAFLKGPIPLSWLQRAARLAGKALQVAIALRYRCGIERTLTVKLTSTLLREFGVERDAKARALRQLERVGLVAVSRNHGRNPVVTVLEVPSCQ
jgi:DNA-binding MarR family transcriptional regulator